MKKNLFLYAALCALVATGCSKQDEAETLQPGQGEAIDITISATRHEAPSTRTEYEEEADRLIVKWNSDKSDKLRVFTTGNGTPSTAQFTVDGDLSADGKTAHFKGTLNVSTPGQETKIYGYYPYSTAGNIPESIPINLSNQQQDGITDKASLAHLADYDYMAATPVTKKLSSGNQKLSLEFHPLLTIMSFKITEAMNVASIKLEAVGESNKTPFHTKGGVDITFETFLIFHNDGTAQSSVELKVTNGSIAAGATGMFNMMIFPITAMPAQFKVTVTTADGAIYEQTKNAPASFVRGKRYIMDLDALTIKDDKVWDGISPAADDNYAYSGGEGTADNPYQIAKANDLAQLAVNVNAGFDANNSFILKNNINLNDHKWTPIGNSGKPFNGTFKGDGKEISGMKITVQSKQVGLFGYVGTGGTIENISVAGEIKISANTNAIIYAGGILGTGDGATLSGNLTNHVDITIENKQDGEEGELNIGGVVGQIKNKAVTGVTLTNDGTLTINGEGRVNVGGVIGYINSDIQSGTTLINSGAVSGTSSFDKCTVGGLIGSSSGAVTFEGTNSGNVRGEKTGGSSPVCCGGLIGFIAKTISKTNTNTGDVTAISSSTYSCSSYAGIRVGGTIEDDGDPNIDFPDLKKENEDAAGYQSTGIITATSAKGDSYVNGAPQ